MTESEHDDRRTPEGGFCWLGEAISERALQSCGCWPHGDYGAVRDKVADLGPDGIRMAVHKAVDGCIASGGDAVAAWSAMVGRNVYTSDDDWHDMVLMVAENWADAPRLWADAARRLADPVFAMRLAARLLGETWTANEDRSWRPRKPSRIRMGEAGRVAVGTAHAGPGLRLSPWCGLAEYGAAAVNIADYRPAGRTEWTVPEACEALGRDGFDRLLDKASAKMVDRLQRRSGSNVGALAAMARGCTGDDWRILMEGLVRVWDDAPEEWPDAAARLASAGFTAVLVCRTAARLETDAETASAHGGEPR